MRVKNQKWFKNISKNFQQKICQNIEGTKLTLHSNNRSPIKATYLIANTLIATIAKTLGSAIAVQLADKISKSIHRH